jgi:hypothetical protein
MPIAVAPTAAVLPIRQTSTETRPAGIDLRVQAAQSPHAFRRAAPAGAPLPLAVPAYDGVMAPPTAPAGMAAPVRATIDPAEWGLDIEAAPASGRRRGAEDDPALGFRRQKPSSLPLPARLFGRGKAGAARLLVLALVVGAEGVAVTTMAGQVRSAPADPSTNGITGAYQLAALSPKAAAAKPAQDAAAAERAEEEAALALAQDTASKAKVTAALQQAKAAADRVQAAADRRARAMRNAQRDPRSVGRIMAAERGWGASEFNCLNLLWNKESQWNYKAQNPNSSAYGIPQALNGKMASAGADWRTNPVTQIKWGLDYIADRYGTPCAAWGHSQSVGWY